MEAAMLVQKFNFYFRHSMDGLFGEEKARAKRVA
jgi:hypothetical protein